MIPLCKAKRIDNGEWVEGYVVGSGKHTFIYAAGSNDIRLGTNWHEVHPSTVCLWTGHKYKDGKRRFDGDLVKFAGQIWEIAWSVQDAGFVLFSTRNHVNESNTSSAGCPIRNFNYMDDGTRGYWQPDLNTSIADDIDYFGSIYDKEGER